MAIFDPADPQRQADLEAAFMDEEPDLGPTELSEEEDDEALELLVQKDDWDNPTEDPEPASSEEAASFLVRFFGDKTLHSGGPIPKRLLLRGRTIEMVLRLDVSDCAEIFHAALDGHPIYKKSRPRMDLFFDLQKQISEKGIPKQHSGGIILAYLKLCIGCDL